MTHGSDSARLLVIVEATFSALGFNSQVPTSVMNPARIEYDDSCFLEFSVVFLRFS